MSNYRLSKEAKKDLINIAIYRNQQFGLTQSNKYREKLKIQLTALTENPLLYPAVDHIRVGYRRAVCGAHSVYYKISEDNNIEIVRVLRNQNTDDI